MSFELVIFLITLFGLAGIGTPVGYSIIASSIMYFTFGDMDVALAGEKILQGLYKSFVLLAVPLFITAANIMNVGTITDRLLSFCVAVVGRFKGGLGHVNVVASLIFSGMSTFPSEMETGDFPCSVMTASLMMSSMASSTSGFIAISR